MSSEERQAGLKARKDGRREDALRHFRAAASTRPADLWSRSDAALELLALKRLPEAEIEARLLIDAAPQFAPAHRALALALRAKGDREGALRSFRAASDADPRDGWNRYDAAIELRDLGRVTEAVDTFRAVTEGAPAAYSLRGLAQIAETEGDRERALDLFQAAAHRRPEDPWFALDVVVTLRQLDRFAEAEARAATLLAAHPEFAPAAAERAELLARLGRAPEAATLFARLLVRDPGLIAAYRGLSRLAAAKNEFEMAAAHLRAAVRQRPDDAFLHLELAGLLKQAGGWAQARRILEPFARRTGKAGVAARLDLCACIRRDEGSAPALKLLMEAHDLDPANPRALLMLGDHWRDAGDLEAADRWYEAALEARPGFFWALIGRAATARTRGADDAALAFLDEAARVDPDNHATIERASLHRDGGEFDRAREALSAVPPSSPRAAQAGAARASILRAEGRWRDAAQACLSVWERAPGTVAVLVEAAEDFARAGRDAEAADALARARSAAPDHPAVLDGLARRALAREDHGQALVHLRRAVETEPGRLWPRIALARLEAVRGDVLGALAAFDACEKRFGSRPEIALARVELLIQVGDRRSAREILGDARNRFPHHPGLRQQAVLSAIEDGGFAEAGRIVETALRTARPGSAEAGRLLFLRSLGAAAQWRIDDAIRDGEAAVTALPGDGWMRNRLIHACLLGLDLDRAGRHLAALAALEAAANRAKGKSANASQSHYGQIHDEFRLDAEALDAVRQARALPDGERARAMRAAVAAFPDSTAAAIQLFIERRRQARPAIPSTSDRAIPRSIHQYWDDPVPPADLLQHAATWRDANPGFSHRLWNEAEARSFLAGLSPAILAAFERSREPAKKADIFRLALLREHGGVYADMDDRCIAGIAPLLVRECSMVLYQEDIGSLGNNFIAAERGHPILDRALRLAVAAVNRGDSDILWLSTGPGLLTRAAAEVICENAAVDARLRVLDRHELLEHVSIHCLAGYKATDRHWSRTAFGRARKTGNQAAARSAA